MDKSTYHSLPKRKKGNKARILVLAFFMLIQVIFLLYIFYTLNMFALTTYLFTYFITAFIALNIALDRRKASYKIAWITVLFIIPIFGLFCYLMWGYPHHPAKLKKRIPIISDITIPLFRWNPQVRNELEEKHPDMLRCMTHLNNAGFPVYSNTEVKYFSLGDNLFPALFEDMKKAQKNIFIEYFIISEGHLLDETLSILEEKAKEGVEIKILYDDFGSISTLSRKTISKIKKSNIEIEPFNKVVPIINNFYLNYRNHQKICIIDGNIAYTGGINLADEYANLVDAYGHWKDSGIRIEGDAVWSMTIMFLQMWQYASGKQDMLHYKNNLFDYAPAFTPSDKASGFVQPFCSGPCNDTAINTAENIYIRLINSAKKYVYITTPYLVLDSELQSALIIASQSGVDVRIITPGIPDKKNVYDVTNSHYGVLLEAGVRIYEYSPGFIHSKNLVCDGLYAAVGTINMDFRSFFLHFENAVWLLDTKCIADIEKDFIDTLDLCREIQLNDWNNRPLTQKIKQYFLKFFSPLL